MKGFVHTNSNYTSCQITYISKITQFTYLQSHLTKVRSLPDVLEFCNPCCSLVCIASNIALSSYSNGNQLGIIMWCLSIFIVPSSEVCWISVGCSTPLALSELFSVSSSDRLLSECGVHQYMGKVLCMLFTRQAIATRRTLPSRTKGIRNHPISVISGDVAANKAVAPAGGWIVLVKPITAEATPTERAPANHRRFSKSRLSSNSFVMPTPMMEANSWPKIAFRGWERGESIVLYSKIAAAPYHYR